MKINVIGNGAFGSFLKELLPQHGFELCDDADSIILAVPLSAYDEVAGVHKNNHLINVCSVQEASTNILLKHTERVTSIHPLFGERTPIIKRNSIITFQHTDLSSSAWNSERGFLKRFSEISVIHWKNIDGSQFTPKSHDLLMSKTHLSAVQCAKQAKRYTDAAKDIPDELIPNSFRLLRQFVQTLDDMPAGTLESIMSNPYI